MNQVAKSVKVHDDTHRALKDLKTKNRVRSMDEVIREMIKETTGTPVDRPRRADMDDELTSYVG